MTRRRDRLIICPLYILFHKSQWLLCCVFILVLLFLFHLLEMLNEIKRRTSMKGLLFVVSLPCCPFWRQSDITAMFFTLTFHLHRLLVSRFITYSTVFFLRHFYLPQRDSKNDSWFDVDSTYFMVFGNFLWWPNYFRLFKDLEWRANLFKLKVCQVNVYETFCESCKTVLVFLV